MFTKSEFDSIRLQIGCGHKQPCVFHGRKDEGDFRTGFVLGRVGLAGLKSQRVEAGCYLNLRS